MFKSYCGSLTLVLVGTLLGCGGQALQVPGDCTGNNNNIAEVQATGEKWLCVTDGSKFYDPNGDLLRPLPLLQSTEAERATLPSFWVEKSTFPHMLGVGAIGDTTFTVKYLDRAPNTIFIPDGTYLPTLGTKIYQVVDIPYPALHALVVPAVADPIKDTKCPSPCTVRP
jgi:hypothetical protein